MVIKNMAYWKAKNRASAIKYRAPQANQTLVQGEKEAGKTTGGSVFTRAAQGVAKNIKATKDMVKEKVVGAATTAATGGVA